MAYILRKRVKTQIKSVEKLEGEPIEHKIERIVSNKEPIKDGAPEIFTERSEGVISAYNIRTDRWEVACDGMDLVSKSIQARRDNKAKVSEKKEEKIDKKETKVVDIKTDVSEAKSIEGKASGE
jgi:hypothetical protein